MAFLNFTLKWFLLGMLYLGLAYLLWTIAIGLTSGIAP